MFKKSICLLISIVPFCFSQFPMSFTEITKNAEFGSAHAVALDNAGNVYLANNTGGLWVFGYDGTSFTDIAHINDGENASAVTVRNDGYIFLANGNDGLRVYSLNANTLNHEGHWNEYINGGGSADVAVSPDGTVFLANAMDGLRAFTWDGSTLTNTAHIHEGDWFGSANALVVASDSLILLSNDQDGIRAYHYDGAAFTALAGANVIGAAYGIAMWPDSTVFAATLDNGIQVFNFTGSAFEPLASFTDFGYSADIAFGGDSTVFKAGSGWGLHAYIFSKSKRTFTKTAEIDDGGSAVGVTVGADGTVFLANDRDGLRAYSFDGSSFSSKGQVNHGGLAMDAAVSAQGLVCLANGGDGLRIYSFDGTALENIGHRNDVDYGNGAESVAQGPDGTIYVAMGSDPMRSYSFDGSTVIQTAQAMFSINSKKMVVDSKGTIFSVQSGLYAYVKEGSDIQEKGFIADGNGSAQYVELYQDSVILMANGSDGLRAYTFNGTDFIEAGHINDGGSAVGIAVDTSGTIFLANDSDGLRAYRYDGSSFTNIAHVQEEFGQTYSVVIDSIGHVYTANLNDGFRAYTFNGTSFTNIGYKKVGNTGKLAIGPDRTLYNFNYEYGLTLYALSESAAPVIEQIPDTSFYEDSSLVINLSATDPDSYDLYFSAHSDTSAVMADIQDGPALLLHFPNSNWVGDANITVTVSDGLYSDSTTFRVTVIPVNDPIKFKYLPTYVVREDSIITVALHVDDVDQQENLVFTATSDTSAVQLELRDSLLTIIPDSNWVGWCTITATVTDGVYSDTAQFQIGYQDVNDPPGRFSLLSPEDNCFWTDSSIIVFTWERPVDADNSYIQFKLKYVYDDVIRTFYLMDTFYIYDIGWGQLPVNKDIHWEVWAYDWTDSTRCSDGFRTFSISPNLLSINENAIPESYCLNQNYPNPFNPVTTIQFGLPEQSDVILRIYDITGRQVKTWTVTQMKAGYHELLWNGTNDFNQKVSTGIYIYRMQAGSPSTGSGQRFIETKKMIFMK